MNAREWKEDYRRFFSKIPGGSLYYRGFNLRKVKGLWEVRDVLEGPDGFTPSERGRVEARKPNLEKAFNFINRRRYNEQKAA